MHNSMKTLIWTKLTLWIFCSQPKNRKICISPKTEKYAFSHGKKHISTKCWSHQKCILKTHNCCVLFFTAIQKCIMDSGRPTFLICTVSPKAVLWWFFFSWFSVCHPNGTPPVLQENIAVSTWSGCSIVWKTIRKWISLLSRLRGFWLSSCCPIVGRNKSVWQGCRMRLQVSGASSRVVEHNTMWGPIVS